MTEERTGDEQSDEAPSERNKPLDVLEAFKRIQRVLERVPDKRNRERVMNAISALYEP